MYREELDAARARNEALEEEKDDLEVEVVEGVPAAWAVRMRGRPMTIAETDLQVLVQPLMRCARVFFYLCLAILVLGVGIAVVVTMLR